MATLEELRRVLESARPEDPSADPELAKACESVEAFVESIKRFVAHVKDPERQHLDMFTLVREFLADEGICIMPVCHAHEIRDSLEKKGFGDFSRRTPNRDLVHGAYEVVEQRGGKLPIGFEDWRQGIIWAAAQRSIQQATSDWPETKESESRVRIVRRERREE